jgi:hypothetical protein
LPGTTIETVVLVGRFLRGGRVEQTSLVSLKLEPDSDNLLAGRGKVHLVAAVLNRPVAGTCPDSFQNVFSNLGIRKDQVTVNRTGTGKRTFGFGAVFVRCQYQLRRSPRALRHQKDWSA